MANKGRACCWETGRKDGTKVAFVSDRTKYISLYQIACSEFVLFKKVFSLSTTKAVVRPINELVSEFWLESRSDGMVDYVCFRLIDIAAQKSTGALVQRIWSCWDEFAHPIRVCDRFEVDGRLLLPAC